MANNEPLYARQKALKMKLFQAVQAKRTHQNMVRYFNAIANRQKALMQENHCVIILNKTDCFASFWRLLE